MSHWSLAMGLPLKERNTKLQVEHPGRALGRTQRPKGQSLPRKSVGYISALPLLKLSKST
jgi:hypothetical protein